MTVGVGPLSGSQFWLSPFQGVLVLMEGMEVLHQHSLRRRNGHHYVGWLLFLQMWDLSAQRWSHMDLHKRRGKWGSKGWSYICKIQSFFFHLEITEKEFIVVRRIPLRGFSYEAMLLEIGMASFYLFLFFFMVKFIGEGWLLSERL